LAARQKAGIKLRRPIGRIIVESEDPQVADALSSLEGIFREQTNCKTVEVGKEATFELEVRGNMSCLGRRLRSSARAVADAIAAADPESIRAGLDEDGHYTLELEGREVRIEEEDLTFRRRIAEHLVMVEQPLGRIFVDTTMTEELVMEGLAKELVRRIQDMRKDLDLHVNDMVDVSVRGPTEKVEGMLDYVARETRASSIRTSGPPLGQGYEKEWRVEDDTFVISIERA
jgi:isoleucyl-tRNA synthetase